MKGPSSHLHVLILGLALATVVSCKGGEKVGQTGAPASKPAPAPAPTAAATATTTAEATTAEPKNKVAPAEVVDATVRPAVDTTKKGPSGEAALLGKPAPTAKGPVLPMINYRVANLAQVIEQLRSEGCQVDEKVDESEFGKFGWVMDPEGNRIELWEPPPGK